VCGRSPRHKPTHFSQSIRLEPAAVTASRTVLAQDLPVRETLSHEDAHRRDGGGVLVFTVTAFHRRDQDIVVCESFSQSCNADSMHHFCPTHSLAGRMTDSAEPVNVPLRV